MTQDHLPRKISTPRRTGDSYELRLFALLCLKTISDPLIEHVWHEDSSAAPVDDVIIEFQDRIECFQAKHAMNPHALLEINFDTAELVDPAQRDFTISFAKLVGAWQSLRSRGKEVIIRIFTNRAAGQELSLFLEDNSFKDTFVLDNFQKRKRQKLHDKIVEEVEISDDDFVAFLSSLRYDLRQPNEAGLDEVIRSDWLQRKFGLDSASVYDRFLRHAERWFLESRTRPIDRSEVLAALQLDNSTLPQIFPVDRKTYVDRSTFEQEVVRVLFRDRGGYTAIVGTPGSGKSTFITRFTDELRDRGQPIVRYYAFTRVNDAFQRERAGKKAFLKSIIEQLYAEFCALIPDERRYDYSEQRLLELLTLLGEHFQENQQQLLMVVDGIDHVGREMGIDGTQKLLNVLPRQLPAGVVCAIGTQSTQYLPESIERQCRDSLLNIPLFEIDQTQDFLSRCFEESSCPSDRTIDLIHKRSEGLPLYLHFIAERLRQASIEEYDNVVAALPPHGGHIDSYYAALWSEFSRDSKLKRLCGLAARLHFRVKTSDLLSMAGMTDAFESELPFDRMKHLLQVSDLGCRVFHNSFRDFINTELSSDQLQQLDQSILSSYLDSRRNQLLWFMYAHRYAEAAKDNSYLIANYGQDYVSAAIRRGRPHNEINEALKATAHAAISERNLVVTAQTAALLHTQDKIGTDIDRAQLWRSMLSMCETDDALAAFSQEQEVYKISTETAKIIVDLAERGQYEFGRTLAEDFINRLPKQIKEVDFAVAVGELISVYDSNPAKTLARWIGTKPSGEADSLYSPADLGTALLPKALRNLYKFERWDVVTELQKLLPQQVGWVDRKDSYLLETIQLETEFRPDKVRDSIYEAINNIQNQDERILLAGHLARHDFRRDIVEKLFDGIILHPQLEYEKSWQVPKPRDFQVFRAYVVGLEYLGRSPELQVISNFLQTSDSSIAAYYQICLTVARSNDRPDQLLAGLTRLGEYESLRGEHIIEIQRSVGFDQSAFLRELVNQYLAGGGEIKLLIERFRYACEGKTFPIPKLMGLEILSTFSELQGYLQDLIVEVHDLIFDSEFETRSRMNELLSISDLACRCGHLSLGRKWQEEAVLATRGYGYRKDPTIGLLIEALEDINSLQPELLPQRVADIAEWNLLMPKVTEDGKEIKWFPISLFKVALSCNPETAIGLLLPYRHHIAEWKFSDSLTIFLCSYKGDNLLLAYTLSELINKGYSEETDRDIYNARIHLLQVAVGQGDRVVTHWIEKHIRKFILTEVIPSKHLEFIEDYNKYIVSIGLSPIPKELVRPINAKNSTSTDPEIPISVELNGEEVATDSLVSKLSISFEMFSSDIGQLNKQSGAYKFQPLIQQALARLLQKTRSISDLDRIADFLQNNRDVAMEGYSLLAGRYLSLSYSDRAAKYYREAFLLKNEFELWNPHIDEFKQLAEIDPNLAFDTLFNLIEQRLEKGRWWGGQTIFLMFLKGALALGENYHQSAIELYDAFHQFIKTQFEHLPSTSSSPYQWLRESDYQIESFEEISKQLIEQAWSAPLLHRRHQLVHLLKDLAIEQPTSIVPWLVELLRHDDYTLNTQSALILAAVALDRSDLLTDYVDDLMAALDPPHAEKCYYLKQALEAIAINYENRSIIIDRLNSLRPRIAGTSLIILPDTLRPSLDFKERTLTRTVRKIQETISNVCELLDLEVDKLHWKIEQEMKGMRFDYETAQQEFDRRGEVYCNWEGHCIPFETYNDYYVWHGFNRVLERELRENVVDPVTQIAIDSLVRLYDPRFPLSEIEPKPIDLNLPSINKDLGSKELPAEIQAWLDFEGEELIKDRLLEGDWIAVFDNYYQKFDRIAEERFATSFLASHAVADRILSGDKIVQSGEAVLKLAPKPPYYSLTLDEARFCLDQSRALTSINPAALTPLLAIHSGSWWHFTRSMTVSTLGQWIQRYNLSWNAANGLNLSFSGKPAQQVLTWSDGFEVGHGRRQQVRHGERLALSRDFLETLMQDYNLSLVVTSWSKRSVSSSGYGEQKVKVENERESISIYRSNH